MYGRPRVSGRDAHRRVLLGRGRAADQQRDRELPAGHLFGYRDHLVEGWRDEARQADGVGAELDRSVQDLFGRHHHAEVVDLVVVAAQHDPDDVLADVVNVALDRREHQLAAHLLAPRRLLFRFHERLEVGDGAFHRARALHDLRQEHLARAEQVTDHLHAIHQRPFDHHQRPGVFLARLLCVGLDVRDLAMQDGVCEAVFDGSLAPRKVDLALHTRARD